MIMNNFVVFILSHGRPDSVITYKTLKRLGYEGPIRIIVDDEDDSRMQYHKNFPGEVIEFTKSSCHFDIGDNFRDRRGVVYARNQCHKIAKEIGYKYFLELDDDYNTFSFRVIQGKKLRQVGVKNINKLFNIIMKHYVSSSATTIAIGQGGDFLGGALRTVARLGYRRKVMNSFFCDVDRPFTFPGRINEDTNYYVTAGRSGELCYSIMRYMLNQAETQKNEGGLTGIYLSEGTYVKSFYSVMMAPSCVTIRGMGETRRRWHHLVKWNACASKILREEVKKP